MSILWAIAANGEPWPRSPSGGNFAYWTTALASSAVLICGTTMPLVVMIKSALLVDDVHDSRHILRSCIQSTFDQVRVCHAKPNERRDIQCRDRSCCIMHRIVADLSMFTIDDDALDSLFISTKDALHSQMLGTDIQSCLRHYLR